MAQLTLPIFCCVVAGSSQLFHSQFFLHADDQVVQPALEHGLGVDSSDLMEGDKGFCKQGERRQFLYEVGLRCVVIKLLTLKAAQASVPRSLGVIKVELKRAGATGLRGTVDLPGSLEGVFLWNGQTVPLGSGRTKINMK